MANPLFIKLNIILSNMKISTIVNSLLILGAIVFFTGNELLEDIGVWAYTIFLLVFVLCYIVAALLDRVFSPQIYRSYMINRGNHYANLMPIFKPHWITKKSIYEVKVRFYNGWYQKPSKLRPEDMIHILHQTNKIWGFNYGLPKMDWKRFKLVHKNSARLGVQLASEDKSLSLVSYMRKDENVMTEYLKPVYKKDKMYTKVYIDLYKGIMWAEGEEEFYLSFYLTKTPKFGYFLSKPYFGGKFPAHADLGVDVIVNKV